MEINLFEKPVSILVGLGYPAKIQNAKQAYEFLSETPAVSSKRAHSLALKACKAALQGEIEQETARSAFIAYAKRSAIFIPDVLAPPELSPSPGPALSRLRSSQSLGSPL